jgi:cytochrome c biogenesis protein ResB
MADNVRTPRSNETREATARRKPWAPPSRLESPQAPEGYVHRWIRVAMRGEEDKTNVFSKLREGWEPVRADEYPDYHAPVIDEGKYAGVIGQGGLMLCRIPVETARERSAYYGLRTREQMQAVDQDLMKDQHPSMPIHQSRQSRVSFGGRGSTE